LDANGDRKDPWSFINTLVFISPLPEASIYTYSTSSRGGFNAIGELCRQHAKAPDETYPLVKLETGSYQHKDRSIGRVKFPVLEIVKHVARGPYDAELAAARGETRRVEAEAPDGVTPIDDVDARPFAPVDAIDDDIEF